MSGRAIADSRRFQFLIHRLAEVNRGVRRLRAVEETLAPQEQGRSRSSTKRGRQK